MTVRQRAHGPRQKHVRPTLLEFNTVFTRQNKALRRLFQGSKFFSIFLYIEVLVCQTGGVAGPSKGKLGLLPPICPCVVSWNKSKRAKRASLGNRPAGFVPVEGACAEGDGISHLNGRTFICKECAYEDFIGGTFSRFRMHVAFLPCKRTYYIPPTNRDCRSGGDCSAAHEGAGCSQFAQTPL